MLIPRNHRREFRVGVPDQPYLLLKFPFNPLPHNLTQHSRRTQHWLRRTSRKISFMNMHNPNVEVKGPDTRIRRELSRLTGSKTHRPWRLLCNSLASSASALFRFCNLKALRVTTFYRTGYLLVKTRIDPSALSACTAR